MLLSDKPALSPLTARQMGARPGEGIYLDPEFAYSVDRESAFPAALKSGQIMVRLEFDECEYLPCDLGGRD